MGETDLFELRNRHPDFQAGLNYYGTCDRTLIRFMLNVP